jgi:predicted alpha/beta-hydrolase family hydrolase
VVADLTIPTPAGDAGMTLEQAPGARRLLVIGHGAGGSVQSPDLVAIRTACLAAGVSVARVTQPYRLAGRRTPPAAAVLDGGWAAVLAALGRRKALAGLEFVYAGRSSGARVACRTAADPAVTPRPVAVVAVAFPVHPPGKPEKSRLPELAAVPQPVLVVQGLSDPFGMPEPAPGRTVRQLAGDHSLKGSAAEAGRLVVEWLAELDG